MNFFIFLDKLYNPRERITKTKGFVEYPQYTRPKDFRGLDVPEVLLSGHHGQIKAWRDKQAKERTRLRRPELLAEPSIDEQEQ